MQPRRANTLRLRRVSETVQANRWVAIAIGLAAMPWLAAGEMELFWLGVVACLTAGAVAWLPAFGRPIIIGCGFFAAAAISCHPLFAGSWHPWQAAGGRYWGIAGAGLVCLPCLLMVVSRVWALELLRDNQGCDNQSGEAR